MIIWINGPFGVGKSTTAALLKQRLPKAHIYDPEQVGAFLWENLPEELTEGGDFQDLALWRSINFDVLRHLSEHYDGHLIVPMTLVEPRYFDEIIGKLERSGTAARHYTLTASRDTIAQRLLLRGDAPGCWAQQQIGRCLDAFQRDIPGIPVDTEAMDAAAAANFILNTLTTNSITEDNHE